MLLQIQLKLNITHPTNLPNHQLKHNMSSQGDTYKPSEHDGLRKDGQPGMFNLSYSLNRYTNSWQTRESSKTNLLTERSTLMRQARREVRQVVAAVVVATAPATPAQRDSLLVARLVSLSEVQLGKANVVRSIQLRLAEREATLDYIAQATVCHRASTLWWNHYENKCRLINILER